MTNNSYKGKCLAMLIGLVSESLEDHYTTGHETRCKDILSMDAFSYLSHPNSTKINSFVSGLMQKIATDKYEIHKEKVTALITLEVKSLVEDFLSEEEAKEFYEFGTSKTGRKVFRNGDLFRSAVQKGRNILVAEIISEWSKPYVVDAISEYIEKIEDTEQ